MHSILDHPSSPPSAPAHAHKIDIHRYSTRQIENIFVGDSVRGKNPNRDNPHRHIRTPMALSDGRSHILIENRGFHHFMAEKDYLY